jgi:hypothetical protein
MNKTKVLAVVAVVLAVATVGTVRAEQWGGPRHHHMMGATMDGDGGGHMGGWMGHRGKGMCGMARHIDGRIAFLKAELKITDSQEKLFDDYAAAMRSNAQAVSDRCTAVKDQGGKRLPLPDRLDRREQFMEARLEALRTTSKALKPLYDALSDTQKESADELIHGSI